MKMIVNGKLMDLEVCKNCGATKVIGKNCACHKDLEQQKDKENME